MNTNPIRIKTVKLIGRLLQPLAEEGLLSIPEKNEIISQLTHLSRKGTVLPDIKPKLITQEEAAEMLSIGHSNFKKLEKEGVFMPLLKRRMVGSAVRYLNCDVVGYILSLNVADASASSELINN